MEPISILGAASIAKVITDTIKAGRRIISLLHRWCCCDIGLKVFSNKEQLPHLINRQHWLCC